MPVSRPTNTSSSGSVHPASVVAVFMPVIVKMPSPAASMMSMSASNTRLLRPMIRRTNGKNSTTDTPSATSR